VSEVEGIDAQRVTDWIARRTEITPPLEFHTIEGGRSNLTYRVTDTEGRRLILRRPPLHSVLQSAHDMGREHRIISALEGSPVPVPPTVGFEDDPEVNGAPFYVMRFVEGRVVRTAEDAESLSIGTRRAAADDLIDVLVRLHSLDPEEVGLGDLARKEDYLARQLRRWHGQLENGRTRELPVLDEVHGRLVADIPEQGPAAIVHGDYRLDNLMLDPETGKVQAVLDWELTTLGDPLADLGLLLVYWTEPEDEIAGLPGAATVLEGFPRRDEVTRLYAERSGRDVSQIDYYYAFGTWKLACILEGVYARLAAGAYGEEAAAGAAGFGDMVVQLGEAALEATAKAGR
jgi:aminoglycoside phosphotransferase (APT) family kinase protein